jgi:flagellar protein FliO/FliZ
LVKPDTAFESTRLHLRASTAAHSAHAGSGGSIMRTVVGLVIVIAVIYGLTWIVRKLKGKDLPSAGDGLERVAALPLGANRSVALVRVGRELHLIGVGEHAVTGIASFSEDEALELGLPVTPPGSTVSYRDPSGAGAPAPQAGALTRLRRMTQR